MTIKTPVYLDCAITTPVDKRVAGKTIPYPTETFGNPISDSHALGWEAEGVAKEACADIAAPVSTDPKEIIFTGGATESDNLAIKGAASFYKTRGKHLIAVETEYKVVFDTMRELERQGFEVTYLDVQENSLVDSDVLKVAIHGDTIPASAMWVNNEIGVVQDTLATGGIYRERRTILHVDTAQACGKVPVDVEAAKVDLLSVSGHKVYGPKSIGTLYARCKPRAYLETQMHGGGRECGLRSGALPTHQIVGMGEVFHIARGGFGQDMAHYRKLHDIFLEGIEGIREIYINGDLKHRVPNNLNASFNSVEGESLVMTAKELAVSSGSACTSVNPEPSYTLRTLDRNDELAHLSLRVTFGRMATEEEVRFTAELVKSRIGKLRGPSPLWGMFKDGVDLNSIK